MDSSSTSLNEATRGENAALPNMAELAPDRAGSPLQCHVCDKVLNTRSALNCHLKCHTAEKGHFACGLCDLEFTHVMKLRKHLQDSHTNADGQFPCPKCAKPFADFQKLKKHMRNMHSGQHFRCEQCTKKFARLDQLRLHQLTHSDVRRFGCHICERRFKRKDKLKEHCKRVHDFVLKTPREKPRSGNINITQMEQTNDDDLKASPSGVSRDVKLNISDVDKMHIMDVDNRVPVKRLRRGSRQLATQPHFKPDSDAYDEATIVEMQSLPTGPTIASNAEPFATSPLHPVESINEQSRILASEATGTPHLSNLLGSSVSRHDDHRYLMRPLAEQAYNVKHMQSFVTTVVQTAVITPAQPTLPMVPMHLDLMDSASVLPHRKTKLVLLPSRHLQLEQPYHIGLHQQREYLGLSRAFPGKAVRRTTPDRRPVNYSHDHSSTADEDDRPSPRARTPATAGGGENWMLLRRNMHCGGSYETASASSLPVSSSPESSAPPFPVGFSVDGDLTGFGLGNPSSNEARSTLATQGSLRQKSMALHESELPQSTFPASGPSVAPEILPLESAVDNKTCAVISEDSLRQLLNRFAYDVPDSTFSKPPSVDDDKRNLSSSPTNITTNQRRDSATFTNLLLSASEHDDAAENELDRAGENALSNRAAAPPFVGNDDLPTFAAMRSISGVDANSHHVQLTDSSLVAGLYSASKPPPPPPPPRPRTTEFSRKTSSLAVTAGSDHFFADSAAVLGSNRNYDDDEDDDPGLLPPHYLGTDECTPFGTGLPNDLWLVNGSPTTTMVSESHSAPLTTTATSTADNLSVYVRRVSLTLESRKW